MQRGGVGLERGRDPMGGERERKTKRKRSPYSYIAVGRVRGKSERVSESCRVGGGESLREREVERERVGG